MTVDKKSYQEFLEKKYSVITCPNCSHKIIPDIFCKKCGIEKGKDEFYYFKERRSTYCKDCSLDLQKKYDISCRYCNKKIRSDRKQAYCSRSCAAKGRHIGKIE